MDPDAILATARQTVDDAFDDARSVAYGIIEDVRDVAIAYAGDIDDYQRDEYQSDYRRCVQAARNDVIGWGRQTQFAIDGYLADLEFGGIAVSEDIRAAIKAYIGRCVRAEIMRLNRFTKLPLFVSGVVR